MSRSGRRSNKAKCIIRRKGRMGEIWRKLLRRGSERETGREGKTRI